MPFKTTHLSGFGARSINPATIPGLELWVDAGSEVYTDTSGTTRAANGDTVALWKDRSGNGRDFSQSTSGARPTLATNVTNSRDVLDFDGTSDFMTGGDLSGLTAGEGFMVLAADYNGGTSRGSWNFGSSSTDESHYPFSDSKVYDNFGTTARKTVGNPTPDLTVFHLYSVISVSGEWTAKINGTQIYTTATNSVSFRSTLALGTDTASTRIGARIAEILVYNAKLSTADRTALHTYLANRYALTIA